MSAAFNSNSGEAGEGVEDDLKIQSENEEGSQSSGDSVCVQWRKRWTGAAAVCLGLLCLLLLALIIGLAVHSEYSAVSLMSKCTQQKKKKNYNSLTAERDTLRNERNQLKNNSSNLAKEKAELQEEVNVRRKPCRPGWIKFNISCYYISTESKDWLKSRQDCRDKGADLAIINSKEEQNFLTGFHDRTWIGLSNIPTVGRWMWVDGTFLVGAGSWRKGEPNSANEDCVEVTRDGWNDQTCDTSLFWACKE
ncbi:CD209 antigen-like protein C [Centroberyx gerrardi]